MSFELIRKIEMFGSREEIEDIIFQAELMVEESRVDVSSVFDEYADKLKQKREFIAGELKSIARRLRGNQNKYEVYADYVDAITLGLLKTAYENKSSTSLVLKEYAPIRKIAMQNKKRVRGALMIPLVMMMVITSVLGIVAGKFLETATTFDYAWFTMFIMEYYFPINITLFVAVVVAFFYMPGKVPFISRVYEKLDSLLAVALAQTLFMTGRSAKEIIPLLRRQFKIEDRKLRGDDYLAMLVQMMNDKRLLNDFEAVDLEMALKYGDFKQTFSSIKEKKFDEVARLGEMVSDVVKNFSIFMIAAPLVQFMVIILNLMSITTSAVGQ